MQASQPSNKSDVLTTKDDRVKAIEFMNSLINGTFNVGGILEKVAGPKYSGYLHLISLNPNDNPAVKFNYFQEPEDLDRCVKGVETIIKVIESEPFSRFRIPDMSVQELINIMVNLP